MLMVTRTVIAVLALAFTAAGLEAQSEPTLHAERAFRDADTAMSAVYRELLRALESAEAKRDLQKSQRAWITFRDSFAACSAGVSSAGGSAYSTDYNGTLAELTEERTKQLKNLLRRAR